MAFVQTRAVRFTPRESNGSIRLLSAGDNRRPRVSSGGTPRESNDSICLLSAGDYRQPRVPSGGTPRADEGRLRVGAAQDSWQSRSAGGHSEARPAGTGASRRAGQLSRLGYQPAQITRSVTH